jgi:hypothetical protein
VRDDNFNSADEQGKKTQRGDPVSDANDGSVPGSIRACEDGRSTTRDPNRIGHTGMISCGFRAGAHAEREWVLITTGTIKFAVAAGKQDDRLGSRPSTRRIEIAGSPGSSPSLLCAHPCCVPILAGCPVWMVPVLCGCHWERGSLIDR